MKNAIKLFLVAISFVMASVITYDTKASPNYDAPAIIQCDQVSTECEILVKMDVEITQLNGVFISNINYPIETEGIPLYRCEEKHFEYPPLIAKRLISKITDDLYLINKSRHDNRCNSIA